MKKIIKVVNSKTSDRGRGFIFSQDDKDYALIKDHVFEQGYDDIEGETIEIIESIEKENWIIIKEFKIIPSESEEEEVEDDSVDENGFIKDIEQKELDVFSPLELLESRFYLSIEKSMKITHADNLKEISKTKNGFISVIQNLLTRGQDPRLLMVEKIDIGFLLFILEAYKRDYSTNDISIMFPKKMEEKIIEDSLIELNEYFIIFSEILEYFPLSDIQNFVQKLKFEVTKEKKYQIVSKKDGVVLEAEVVKSAKSHKLPSFLAKDNLKYKDLVDVKEHVNKILKLVFYNKKTKITALKDEQLSALNLLMNGQQNILAVLKTGFGKSLIYQFASVLQPRIFINVFPIRSLIKDQTISLEEEFNLSYVIDNERLRRLKKDDYPKILSNKRMFMVTPERIENKAMQIYFESLHKMIGYMIFDEAHCISEWGHDFRPSYLMARHLMENLMENGKLNVIALTATAAPHIQKDIAELLSINRRHIVNIADSSGLKRKEITYKLIKNDIHDFDHWNRSNKFARIIDQYIEKSFKECKQGIAFFMKSGAEGDLGIEKESGMGKFKRKINAFSTFHRLKESMGAKGLGLYTGQNKLIENEEGVAKFHKFQEMKYIIATKSFGMGINLKDCDYVLLTEPPYSLEDLYQQAGRVGRMGQESVVEILYHNNSLIDPLEGKSPYQFFLTVDENRKNGQQDAILRLIKIILSKEKPFELKVNEFYESYSDDKQNYLKWAISHLITEFDLIKKYYIAYGAGQIVRRIGLFPSKVTEKQLLDRINKKNESLGQKRDCQKVDEAIKEYYEYYFDKLQNDKLVGINILREKLNFLDANPANANDVISGALTQYYKTRIDQIDILAGYIYERMLKRAPLNAVTSYISVYGKNIDKFELMEAVARYGINSDYVEVASLMIHNLYDEPFLVSSKEKVMLKEYEDPYLNYFKDEIIYKEIYLKDKEENKKIKQKLLNIKKWRDIEELKTKIKIMEVLNG